MIAHVRVLLFARAPAGAPNAVLEVYHQISQRLVGTPGLLNSELLQDVGDSHDFVVMSEWSGIEAFQRWERGPGHGTTASLRPYHHCENGSGRAFGIFTVTAEYREPPT
jgi:heme oxygenase (mycobilin-producing)